MAISYHPAPDTITFDAAIRDLDSRDARVRAAAAHALGSVEDPDDRARAARALLTALADARAEIRATAAMSLGELGQLDAAEALENRLDDGDPAVRQTAAIALGRLGADRALPRLREALANGPPDLRFQAATSLAEIAPDTAYDPLVAALDDPDREVQSAVALALARVGDRRAAGPLADLLEHPHRRTRFDAAYALAQLGDGRAAGVLATYADDRDLGWDAVEALELLGDPAGAEPLARTFDRALLPRPLRLRAAAAVLAIAPESASAVRARRVLEAGLRAWKHEHRGLAVELLGRSGAAWATDALRALRGRRAGRHLREEIDDALAHLAEKRP